MIEVTCLAVKGATDTMGNLTGDQVSQSQLMDNTLSLLANNSNTLASMPFNSVNDRQIRVRPLGREEGATYEEEDNTSGVNTASVNQTNIQSTAFNSNRLSFPHQSLQQD
mmetsp:Transcript_820/g.1474  ORF Transcript_820/g.1474 Transcript_820/m.1474 type:complete len:110 (+) Transcript_820:369-698(+)